MSLKQNLEKKKEKLNWFIRPYICQVFLVTWFIIFIFSSLTSDLWLCLPADRKHYCERLFMTPKCYLCYRYALQTPVRTSLMCLPEHTKPSRVPGVIKFISHKKSYKLAFIWLQFTGSWRRKTQGNNTSSAG